MIIYKSLISIIFLLIIIVVIFLFRSLIYSNKLLLINYYYIFLEGRIIELSIKFEKFSLLVSITVIIVRLIISLYSIYYLNNEKFSLFLLIINIFILRILLVVNRSRLVLFILGWDGLGLTSYLLVAYYNNQEAINSRILVILINRISDLFLIFVILLVFTSGSWRIILFKYLNINDFPIIIMIFIFITCTIKRAQIPFSKWLPLAIAAPTPISSLVHSSTLVIAGVYLYYQFLTIFTDIFIFITINISIITSLIFSIGLCYELDLKKNVAYTTLIQLGYIFIMLSLKLKIIVIYHIIMHALYKSRLFIVSGIYIFYSKDNQNLKIDNNLLICPIRISIILIFNLTSWGVPYLSRFYSKDIIIDYIFLNENIILLIIFFFLRLLFSIKGSISIIIWIIFLVKRPLKYKTNLNLISFSSNIILFLVLISGLIISWFIEDFELMRTFKFYKIISYFIIIWGVFLSFLRINLKNNKNESILINNVKKIWGYKFILLKLFNIYYFNYIKDSLNLNQYWISIISYNYIFTIINKNIKFITKFIFIFKISIILYIIIFIVLVF